MSDVKLPEQVRRLQAETEELVKTQFGDGKTGGEENPELAPVDLQKKPENPQPKPTPQPENNLGPDWEQKFHTLQGKYNSEVPVLHADLRALTAERDRLQQECDFLKSQKVQQQEQERHPADSDMSDLDLDSLAEFGPEFAQLVTLLKKTHGKLEAQNEVILNLQGKVQDASAQVQGVQEIQQQQTVLTFEDKLSKACPQWKELNYDQGFNDWLDENGFRETLNLHAQNKDVERTAKLFNRYLAETSSKLPVEPDPKPKEPEHNPVQPRLEDHVSPEIKNGGEVPVEDSKPVFTTGSVNDFYAKYQRRKFPFEALGRIVVTEEDAEKLEFEITRADREGRVR